MGHSRKSRLAGVAGASLLGLAVMQAASAQAELEEIIVTAQKREQSLQDVPVAVTAFTSEELADRTISNLFSIAESTPNLQIGTSGTGAQNAIVFIRGIGQTSNRVNLDQGVGTYVDGIYRTNVWGGLFDLLDVERIEVLRGPQGTLYGKNALGGAINVISKRPNTAETGGEVAITLGSYSRVDAKASVNIPLIQDQLAIQLSAGSRNADGYIETPDGNDFGSEANTGFRIAALWNLSDTATWLLSADQMRTDSNGSPIYHAWVNPNARLPAQYNALVDGGHIPGPRYDESFIATDPLRSNATDPLARNKTNQETISSRLEFEFGGASLVSLTSYKTYDTSDGFDADGSVLEVSNNRRWLDGKAFSQEFQLNGVYMEDRLNLTTGVYYLRDELDFNAAAGNSNSAIPFVGVVPGIRDFNTGNRIEQELDSYAFYASGTYSFTERARLTLGLRYMSEEKSQASSTTRGRSTRPSTASASAKGDWSNASPRISIEYDLNDAAMLYVTAAQAFKSGGIGDTVLEDSEGNNFLLPFNEEKLWSFEAGLKADWADGRVRANLAAFFMDYEDLHVRTTLFDPNSGSQVRTFFNAGSAEASGIEAELTALATDRFVIQASLGFLDTQYNEDVIDEFRNDVLLVAGESLPFAPELSYSLSLIYSAPLANSRELRLRADYSWRDELLWDATGAADDRDGEDSYGLLNLSATYDFERWSLTAFGRNVTDEIYDMNGFVNSRVVGANWRQRGRPAEWGLRATAQF
ncbi:MAG: TonB-dependent receptor [Gammaproteobacteria bacterium]|nr:TonB-dependent receptor [Gammaproteobacteria bacterium]